MLLKNTYQNQKTSVTAVYMLENNVISDRKLWVLADNFLWHTFGCYGCWELYKHSTDTRCQVKV